MPEPALPRLPLRRLFWVLALAASGYAVLLAWGSGGVSAGLLSQLSSQLFSVTGLAATALCLASYALRGWRWRAWMAQAGRPLGALEGLRLYVAGYALTPTPGNVGEAARGLWLARQPLSLAGSLAIFAAERLADLLGLLLIALPAALWLGLSLMTSGEGASGLSAFVADKFQGQHRILWGLALALVLGSLGALLHRARVAGLAGRAAAKLDRWLSRFKLWRRVQTSLLKPAWQSLSHRPAQWLLLTLLAWAAQGLAVALLCAQAGLDTAAWLAAGLYALAMVGGALSALPAGLGGTELLLAALLAGQGASAAVAVAITLVVRLLTLWLAVALGLVALFYSAFWRKDLRWA